MLAITGPLKEAANLVVATDIQILDPLCSSWEDEIIPTINESILYILFIQSALTIHQ
jgi:hypothetical protein